MTIQFSIDLCDLKNQEKMNKEKLMSSVEDRVKKVVSEHMDVDINELKEGTHYQKDLGADSLDAVEFVMALEEEFDVEVPDEEAEKLVTVGATVKYFQENA